MVDMKLIVYLVAMVVVCYGVELIPSSMYVTEFRYRDSLCRDLLEITMVDSATGYFLASSNITNCTKKSNGLHGWHTVAAASVDLKTLPYGGIIMYYVGFDCAGEYNRFFWYPGDCVQSDDTDSTRVHFANGKMESLRWSNFVCSGEPVAENPWYTRMVYPLGCVNYPPNNDRGPNMSNYIGITGTSASIPVVPTFVSVSISMSLTIYGCLQLLGMMFSILM